MSHQEPESLSKEIIQLVKNKLIEKYSYQIVKNNELVNVCGRKYVIEKWSKTTKMMFLPEAYDVEEYIYEEHTMSGYYMIIKPGYETKWPCPEEGVTYSYDVLLNVLRFCPIIIRNIREDIITYKMCKVVIKAGGISNGLHYLEKNPGSKKFLNDKLLAIAHSTQPTCTSVRPDKFKDIPDSVEWKNLLLIVFKMKK